MFSELEENKKVYDEDELEAEVMKLKQIHIREPGMEDPPPPPPHARNRNVGIILERRKGNLMKLLRKSLTKLRLKVKIKIKQHDFSHPLRF